MLPRKLWRSTLAAAALLLACGIVRAQDISVPEQIVDVMNKLWGKQQAGVRANHAKGVMVEGSFSPIKDGAGLSKAALFRGGAVPLIARFSDSTGLPNIPDADANANPHGFAVKFHLPDGSEMDAVLNSLKFFPVATGEEFRDLLEAVAASGNAPKPTPIDKYFEAHPQALKAFGTVATPASFAQETYRGIDAFLFVDSAGKRQPFRFLLTPDAGERHLNADEAARQGTNFLVDEIGQRLAKGPVTFHLRAQLADPGDQTKDPTQPWPDDRKVVELGTIILTKLAADTAENKALVFFPENLPDGVEVSDDPLIDIRNQAYAISLGRRLQ